MAGRTLSFSLYRPVYLHVSCSQTVGLGGFDDGPKEPSSSLRTLVMRISRFLLQPIKGGAKRRGLFLACGSPSCLQEERMYGSKMLVHNPQRCF